MTTRPEKLAWDFVFELERDLKKLSVPLTGMASSIVYVGLYLAGYSQALEDRKREK